MQDDLKKNKKKWFGRHPHFFLEKEDDLFFLKMEDDLKMLNGCGTAPGNLVYYF